MNQEGKVPKNVAIIHCVGSRNENYHEYCSRMCCMTALNMPIRLAMLLPDSNIYEIYADMRAIGKGCEELYTSTSRKNDDVSNVRPEEVNAMVTRILNREIV